VFLNSHRWETPENAIKQKKSRKRWHRKFCRFFCKKYGGGPSIFVLAAPRWPRWTDKTGFFVCELPLLRRALLRRAYKKLVRFCCSGAPRQPPIRTSTVWTRGTFGKKKRNTKRDVPVPDLPTTTTTYLFWDFLRFFGLIRLVLDFLESALIPIPMVFLSSSHYHTKGRPKKQNEKTTYICASSQKKVRTYLLFFFFF
jgi:hypothetical protein